EIAVYFGHRDLARHERTRCLVHGARPDMNWSSIRLAVPVSMCQKVRKIAWPSAVLPTINGEMEQVPNVFRRFLAVRMPNPPPSRIPSEPGSDTSASRVNSK